MAILGARGSDGNGVKRASLRWCLGEPHRSPAGVPCPGRVFFFFRRTKAWFRIPSQKGPA